MKKVDDYIKKQKSPQKEILKKLRRLIRKTLPKAEEGFKVGVPWYGKKVYIVGLKDSVNIGFSIQGLPKKDLELFQGKGKLMRHIKIRTAKDIDEKQISKLLKLVQRKSKCTEC